MGADDKLRQGFRTGQGRKKILESLSLILKGLRRDAVSKIFQVPEDVILNFAKGLGILKRVPGFCDSLKMRAQEIRPDRGEIWIQKPNLLGKTAGKS